MTKYSNEFKMKVIRAYLKGKSSRTLADEYHVPTHSQVLKWVHQFQVNGCGGLKKCACHPDYTFHFKLNVLKWMKENHSTFENTACHFKIPAVSTVYQWEKRFEIHGVDELKKNGDVHQWGNEKIEATKSKRTRRKR